MTRRGLPFRLAAVAALALAAGGASAAGPDGAARARLDFVHHCIGCHLMDGSGAPSKGIPSMRDALGRFLLVPGGREFIVQVPGVMNSPLNDGEVAALMNWLLPYVAASTMPRDTAPYTADEIARLRKTRPLDVMAERRRLADALRERGIELETDAPQAALQPH